MRSEFGRRLQGIGLVLLAWCAFFPALFNRFIWDDGPHLADNTHLRTLGGLLTIWARPLTLPQYYPVTHTVWWFAYHLWGLAPAGYHAMNIVVHGGSALLLWELLRRLKIPNAWFAAALFAVHPVQVETVAWAMEFKSVLSGFFYFLALLILLPCWQLTREEALAPAAGRRRYLIGMLVFLLSLLSKSVTATLPAVVLLTVWWKRGRITRGEIGRAIPLFAIGIFSGFLTALLERTHVGAAGPEWNIPFLNRILIAGRAVCTYCEKDAWPERLAFFYPRWNIDPGSAGQYVFPAGVLAAILLLWVLRKRIGRGYLAAALFFIGTLLPALGFVNVYPMRFSYVADHFQYLACIGLFVAAAGVLTVLQRGPVIRHAVPPLCAVMLLCLGTLTLLRCRVFYDNDTLFADNVRAQPGSWAAHTFFAASCFRRGQTSDGLEHAALGVALNCNDVDAREALADALGGIKDPHAGQLLELPHIVAGADPRLLDILSAAFADAGDRARAEDYRRRAATAP